MIFAHESLEETPLCWNSILTRLSLPPSPSQAMHHALTSAYPQTRYPVAKINRAEVAIVFLVRQLLPDRLFDKGFLLNA